MSWDEDHTQWKPSIGEPPRPAEVGARAPKRQPLALRTYAEVGQILGMWSETVRQIENRAFRKIQARLTSDLSPTANQQFLEQIRREQRIKHDH